MNDDVDDKLEDLVDIVKNYPLDFLPDRQRI